MMYNSELLNFLLPHSQESFLTSDMSHQQACIFNLGQSFLKKLEPTGVNVDAEKAALALFIEVDQRCDQWRPNPASYHINTMHRVREILWTKLHTAGSQRPSVNRGTCLMRLRPGPGASIGAKTSDFIGKLFFSKLTTYDPSLWRYYMDSIPTGWKHAELLRPAEFRGCDVVDGSNMTFAKKYTKIARVINTEASLEMLFQLALGAQLEDVLMEGFNISLSTQPTVNRYLAMMGSIDGSYATIDLKSASDSISTRFMEWVMPSDVYRSLYSVRAKRIKLPNGKYHQLSMFSTMGNGFTFPLQTLIFASIVEAAYEELGLPTYNHGSSPAFSVFGDDIICVKYAYEKVLSLLAWCGFTVNKNKSFNSGGFRESCGSDFFKGRNVRGVYLRKLTHESHVFSIFNRLTRWSAKNGIDLTCALALLYGYSHHKWHVPFDCGDDSGFKVPLCMCKPTARGGKHFYSYYVPIKRTLPTTSYESNPAALLQGALGGYVSGTGELNSCLRSSDGALVFHGAFKPMEDVPVGSLTLRNEPDGPPQVKRARDSTPSWDWIPHKGLTTLDYMISLENITFE